VAGNLGARFCGGVLALVVLIAGSSASATMSQDEAAHVSVACSALAHPVLKYPYLFAIGKFRCASGAPSAKATLVLQAFKHGTWTKIQAVSRKVHARRGKKYVLRTTPTHCASNPHKLKVRTEFDLEAGSLRLHPPPSGTLQTFCL
jgi:hypothetical protein